MKPFLFLVMLFPLVAFSQLNERFTDGNFTKNPVWSGTGEKFIVNSSFQLQLNDSVAGTAWLSTPFELMPETAWEIWVKTKYSPSSKNFIRIFLAADKADLTRVSKGYYLQLGEAGSDDALELFRKSGDTTVSICRGTTGLLARHFTIRIKVLHFPSGEWQLFVDPSGGKDFRREASGKDDRHDALHYFGLYCRYTKSNAKKDFFDDIYGGVPQADTVPPSIDSVLVANDHALKLFFSERVDSASAKKPSDYSLSPSVGLLSQVSLSRNGRSALLTFSKAFRSNRPYVITVSGITDVAGNSMKKRAFRFLFLKPYPGMVVFNEIMADPIPSVRLPAFEYLELFNRDTINIDLDGWRLKLGNTVKTFNRVTLAGKGYLILCKNSAREAFSSYGNTYGFSSFSLLNAGEEVQLFDNKEQLISSVKYDKSWYKDPAKANGGWSLEQINPENTCSGEGNWKAAENSLGGTPGTLNSVYDARIVPPEVVSVLVPDNHSLVVSFSQKMDSLNVVHPAFYVVSPTAGSLERVSVSPDHNSTVLTFARPFDTAVIYSLTLSGKLQNCKGQHLAGDTSFRFGLPQPAGNNDLVINELLFYPLSGGADYVELYNRSHKTIDLATLILGTVKETSSHLPDSLFYDLTRDQKLLLPGGYMVLTSSPEKVKAQYRTKNPHAFLKVNPFPLFSKDHGSVMLFRQMHKIDAFDYTDKMQYPLLTTTRGVALERIRAGGPTNDPGNWHSAAENVGFGTPGYRNSQAFGVQSDTLRGQITIDPEIFSPDNDGYQDALHIEYNLNTSGNTMTINIFNASGQLVRHLVNNAYVGTRGVFSWDGLTDNGTKASVGIYVLLIRVFDETGRVERFKKTAVLATKL